MVATMRQGLFSWVNRSLLFALLLVPAGSAQATCPPEDCLPIVPFPDVPYLSGDVDFVHFGATVTVRDAVATTVIELTVRNDGTQAAQAQVALPLPDGAAILGFNLTIGERVLIGHVLETSQAQARYDEAVERGVDAALLKQADKRLVSLSLNIAPGEQRILRAAYAEAVPLAAGSRVYRLPLSHLDPLPAGLDLTVDVASSLGAADLKASGFAIPLSGGKGAFSATPTTTKDLVLTWKEEVGSRSSLVAAAPLAEGPTEVLATLCLEGSPLARDVVFILDQSGSMRGLKMEEGRQALVAALGTVTPQDRYSVIPFSNDAVPFASALVQGTRANVQAAQARAAKLDIEGGTNIDASLQEAFRQLAAASPSDRLPMVVFMTDGLPTVGVTDHDQIIDRARVANTRHAPIIVVPIGLDADYTFMADLALRSGGAYVDPGTPDAQLSDRLARLAQVVANPIASDISLTIDGADPASIYPKVLPPVYAEDCLEVRFRTTGNGPVTLRLQGTGADGSVTLVETFQPADVPVAPPVRNLWAQAMVAELLSQERDGDDAVLRAAIIANATQYGLLTPHTSWVLVDQAPAPLPEGSDVSSAAMSGTWTSRLAAPGVQYDQASGAQATGTGSASDAKNKTPGIEVGLAAVALAALAVLARRR